MNTLALIATLAIAIPLVTYYSVKMGRAGYLQASRRFNRSSGESPTTTKPNEKP